MTPTSLSMVTSPASPSHVTERTIIRQRARVLLAASGLASWIGGGAASFLGKGGAGAAALIVTGAVCLVLSLVGRWPSRISVSGNEMSWDAVRETVESQIEAAQTSDSTSSTDELKVLLDRLAALQQTGEVAEHPAEAFDRGVAAALVRLLPGAVVVRSQARGNSVPDFRVIHGGREFYVETKWRADPTAPFKGRTLPVLLSAMQHRGGKLLVVANAGDDLVSQARDLVVQALHDDGRVVGWRDVRDDPVLAQALAALLAN